MPVPPDEPMPRGADGASIGEDTAGTDLVWQGLDRSLPWLMVGAAFLGFFALPFDETFHVDNGAPLTALLVTIVFVWAALALAASVLAVRHAMATRGQPRLAWGAVPIVLSFALPMALSLLGEHEYTEQSSVCSPGILPAGFAGALFGWLSWAVYRWVPLVALAVGLGCLALPETRRPGAWILASLTLGVSLWMTGFALIVNHCD